MAVTGQDGLDNCPGGLHRVLAGKQRAIAYQSVAQQAFIRRLGSCLLFEQVEFPLLAEEILPRSLDPSCQEAG